MSLWVDCSSNNGIPDLAAYAKAGHADLCRKVSEGVGYHWAEGDQVADDAHNAGLHVGHYHWLRPDANATAQAAYFVGLVKAHLHPGDWIMTDFEKTANVPDPADVTRAAQLHEFNSYVRAQLPSVPLYVYTGNWYLAGKPHCQAECRRWPIVMSDYSGATALPNPYQLRYVAWQFTDKAAVPGFPDRVDYNRWLAHAPASTTTGSDQAEEMALSPEAQAEINQIVANQLARYFPGQDGHQHQLETLVAEAVKPIADQVARIAAKVGA